MISKRPSNPRSECATRVPLSNGGLERGVSSVPLVLRPTRFSGWPWRIHAATYREDPVTIESAVQFLEADPMFFRSGYIKEEFLEHLSRGIPLNDDQKKRLQQVFLLRVRERRTRREFRRYCRLAPAVSDPSFEKQIAKLAGSSGEYQSMLNGFWHGSSNPLQEADECYQKLIPHGRGRRRHICRPSQIAKASHARGLYRELDKSYWTDPTVFTSAVFVGAIGRTTKKSWS